MTDMCCYCLKYTYLGRLEDVWGNHMKYAIRPTTSQAADAWWQLASSAYLYDGHDCHLLLVLSSPSRWAIRVFSKTA